MSPTIVIILGYIERMSTYKSLSTPFKVTAKFVCEDWVCTPHLQTHYTVHAIYTNHAAYMRVKTTAFDRVYVFSGDLNEWEVQKCTNRN